MEDGFIYSFDEDNKLDCFEMVIIVNFPTRYLNIKENENKDYASLLWAFKISKIKFFPRYIPINEISSSNLFLIIE